MLMQWDVPQRAAHCTGGQEPFVPGSDYISYMEVDEDACIREDYCPTCWEKVRKKKQGVSWKGKIPLKKEKILSKDEKALELFRETYQKQESATLYLLAAYLERRKQLVKRGEWKGKLTFENPLTGETFLIQKKELGNEEVDNVRVLLDVR